MSSRLRLLVWGAVVPLLLASCFVLVHLQQVHQRSNEWGWSPRPAAEQIQFAGRNYRRSATQVLSVPVEEVLLGRTEGGGRIYGVPPGRLTAVVLRVVDGDNAFRYSLMGGP